MEAEEAGGGGRGRDGVGARGVERERGGVGAGEVVRGEEREVEAVRVHERGREDERRAVGGEGDVEQRRIRERARRLVEGVAEDVVDAERVGFVPFKLSSAVESSRRQSMVFDCTRRKSGGRVSPRAEKTQGDPPRRVRDRSPSGMPLQGGLERA